MKRHVYRHSGSMRGPKVTEEKKKKDGCGLHRCSRLCTDMGPGSSVPRVALRSHDGHGHLKASNNTMSPVRALLGTLDTGSGTDKWSKGEHECTEIPAARPRSRLLHGLSLLKESRVRRNSGVTPF